MGCFGAVCVLVVACAAGVGARPNVLLVIADNMRPSMGLYGDAFARTPHLDAHFQTRGSRLFSRAYCQVAWCAPSRNSFLSGRYPMQTLAYNFLSSFRTAPGGENWVSLPQFFKEAGYYTTSVGKVFHPGLPKDFDYPKSWSDVPYFPVKPQCPNHTMYCELPASEVLTDSNCTREALERMTNRPQDAPFFLAVGYQAPRLPWRFSSEVASKYPPVQSFPIPSNRNATSGLRFEWFRLEKQEDQPNAIFFLSFSHCFFLLGRMRLTCIPT